MKGEWCLIESKINPIKGSEIKNDDSVTLLQTNNEKKENSRQLTKRDIKEIQALIKKAQNLLDIAEENNSKDILKEAQQIVSFLKKEVYKFPESKEKDYLTKVIDELFACANISLVYYVANKYVSTGISFDELVNLAMYGYSKALKTFKPEKNIKFATYSIKCMTNEINFFLRKEKRHNVVLSLDAPLAIDSEGNSLKIKDLVDETNVNEKTLEEKIIDKERENYIKLKLKNLTKEEQYIIKHRYSIGGAKFKTQREIAKDIGMSQANVSKIERYILDSLKNSMIEDNYQFIVYMTKKY